MIIVLLITKITHLWLLTSLKGNDLSEISNFFGLGLMTSSLVVLGVANLQMDYIAIFMRSFFLFSHLI